MTKTFIAVVACLTLLLLAIQTLRLSFYQGYFDMKQRDAGAEPRTVLKQVFPRLWWFFC